MERLLKYHIHQQCCMLPISFSYLCIIYCIRLWFEVVNISLYTQFTALLGVGGGGGYLRYFKFAHSSPQTMYLLLCIRYLMEGCYVGTKIWKIKCLWKTQAIQYIAVVSLFPCRSVSRARLACGDSWRPLSHLLKLWTALGARLAHNDALTIVIRTLRSGAALRRVWEVVTLFSTMPRQLMTYPLLPLVMVATTNN